MTNNDMNIIAEAKNAEEMSQAIVSTMEQKAREIENRIRADYDSAALANRGTRQLTSEERKFYTTMANAMRTANPMQELTNTPMPQTIVEAVFDDLAQQHPLLDMVDFVSTPAVTEFVYNAAGYDAATWGPLTDAFKKELNGSFKIINLTANKLSAFIIVPKALLEVGPEWLDRYVRAFLAESIAEGLEDGIINGNGKDAPIGMIKDLTAAIDPSTGYADKTAVSLTDLTPKSYAKILATLAQTEAGNARPVDQVYMIVNPVDYLNIVFPATTQQVVTGGYVNNVFPYATTVIQSKAVPSGKAIFGLAKKYFFGLTASTKEGRIEFSDDVKFLDDQRAYATKLYGNGTPKDNNAFVVADISKLKVTYPTVNTATTTA